MSLPPAPQTALLVASAFLAGAVNAMAGGGTLLTFPALVFSGFASNAANATSTVALFPGQLTSLLGLREHLGDIRRLLAPLVGIGVVGGLGGAWLLTLTPARVFDRVVPFLILMATLLFLAQEPLAKRRAAAADAPREVRVTPGVAAFLLLVALYGGYFGAGIGILTLAALGMLGLRDIHRMNAVKAIFTLGANGVAAGLFLVKGMADIPVAATMVGGALAGGYAGARFGKRIGARNVRRVVVVIGFALALVQLVKAFR